MRIHRECELVRICACLSELAASATDPLGHDWSFGHDAAGNTGQSVYWIDATSARGNITLK